MQPDDGKLGLARSEAGYILIAVGLLAAYISIPGVVGNIDDSGPLCSDPHSLPACLAGQWLIAMWAAIGGGGVVTFLTGVFLALLRRKNPKS